MGILADLFSYGDGLKRKVNNLIADPAGTIGLGVTRFGEDQNALLNLMQNAYPMAGQQTVLNSPEQVAMMRKQLADKATEQAMAGATVWHGSPHKFDKFDASKIGTGEGAQAYGHGLYLAESPDVAKGYRDALASGKTYGSESPFYAKQSWAKGRKDAAIEEVFQKMEDDGLTSGEAIQGLLSEYRSHTKESPSLVNPWLQRRELKKLDPSKFNEHADGQLYKVDLPDEHIAKMLDWDKPLSQQHPDVQSALQKGYSEQGADYPINSATPKTGREIYDDFRALAGGFDSLDPRAASSYLQQQGIPGIRYLDGGSRGAGQGSSNFVVFPGNEGLLNIMERNGQPVLNKLLGK